MIQIALLGAGLGVVMWLLTSVLQQTIFASALCVDKTTACSASANVSGMIAAVAAGLVGLMGLVRFSVYRPLLIVLAAGICLWSLGDWVYGLQWYEGLSWSVLLYGFAYSAFAWLVRPRPFVQVVIILLMVIVLAKCLPML